MKHIGPGEALQWCHIERELHKTPTKTYPTYKKLQRRASRRNQKQSNISLQQTPSPRIWPSKNIKTRYTTTTHCEIYKLTYSPKYLVTLLKPRATYLIRDKLRTIHLQNQRRGHQQSGYSSYILSLITTVPMDELTIARSTLEKDETLP